MKMTLLGIMCALVISLPTKASVNRPFFPLVTKFQGSFTQSKTIYHFNYRSEKDCHDDGGFFVEDSCEFPSQDEVKVKKINNLRYEITISTIGTNSRSCLFIGEATPISSKTLVAKDSESQCEVTLKYKGENSVSVDSTPDCSYYCAARVQLLIDEATRDKRHYLTLI